MARVALVQVGIGTVGGEVVSQVLAHRAQWRRSLGLDVRVAALVGRGGALAAEEPGAGLPDDVLRRAVADRRDGLGLEALPGRARDLVPPAEAVLRLAAEGPTIVMDAAAGEPTAVLDARALAARAEVVLSNKAPLALPLANPLAAALWDNAGPRGHLRYEATCGAGLPVISTLRTLLDTGDEAVEIVGALSGTLGAIFSDLEAGASFSEAVRGAKAKGYTEPDPRDDLSGLDVARKALILARTIGRRADLADVAVESLVPAGLADVPAEAFLERVGEADAAFAERSAAARAEGAVLRYVATVTPDGPLAVGVRAVPVESVLGSRKGPENVVVIRTRRYDAHPLTIVGPGAGAAVTAAGMLGDAISLALGRRG